MKIIIKKASDWEYEEHKEIKDENELGILIVKMIKEYKCGMITEKEYTYPKDYNYRIIIYDDYVE